MASYAHAKSKTVSAAAKRSTAAPSELSDAEKEVIAERVRTVKQHIPEALDLLKALHNEGLVDGLRCLSSVTVYEEVNHGSV